MARSCSPICLSSCTAWTDLARILLRCGEACERIELTRIAQGLRKIGIEAHGQILLADLLEQLHRLDRSREDSAAMWRGLRAHRADQDRSRSAQDRNRGPWPDPARRSA